jgi:hypothetical protein
MDLEASQLDWALRSPDLSPLDFEFWGFLKAQVYAGKIRDIRHLGSKCMGHSVDGKGGSIDPMKKDM